MDAHSRKWMNRGLWSALGVAAVTGTYQSHDHDFPPFYTDHVGVSYGVSLGLVQDIEEKATHSGMRISLGNGGKGTVNGLELGLINVHSTRINEKATHSGTVNGIQLGAFNVVDKMNGLRLGLFNISTRSNGVDIGAINRSEQGTHVQIGIVNFSDRKAEYYQLGLVNIIDSEEDPDYLSGSFLINWNSTEPVPKDK